jgi:hypothetical protein
VRFKILGADAPATSSLDIATSLSNKYAAGTLNASYPILDLKVALPGVTSATSSASSTSTGNGGSTTSATEEDNGSCNS